MKKVYTIWPVICSSYTNFDEQKGGLSHFSVFSAFVDNANTLWIGTYAGGVSYSNPLNSHFTFYDLQGGSDKLFGIFALTDLHVLVVDIGNLADGWSSHSSWKGSRLLSTPATAACLACRPDIVCPNRLGGMMQPARACLLYTSRCV